MNQRIALYLSGQYPGNYRLPNRLDIIFKIRELDLSNNFNDTILGQLQGKSDGEYFTTLLDIFKDKHGENKLNKLLDNMKVPLDVRKDPYEKSIEITHKEILNIKEIDLFLEKIDEETFARLIISPILESMGYEDIEYKGKVNETDSGIDYYPIKYTSPGGIVHYAGVQVKSAKMTNGDTSKTGSEGNKLLEETKTAFNQSHILPTGEYVYISEYLIFNSKESPESARQKFFNDKDIKDKKIIYHDCEGVLNLINKLDFKKDFFSNLK